MQTKFNAFAFAVCLTLLLPRLAAVAADLPVPTQGDYVIKDFHFASGQTLPELKIHYRTLGTPQRDAKGVVRNAVLIMHGTTGSGAQFMGDIFAGELFGPGQPLDVAKFYVILPDDIGHGESSRPSEGLHAKFPNYQYADMVDAEHRLVVDGLHVNHLRLVMGTSMGGMHVWMWGEAYPDMMDALMPLASLPAPVGGRNRVWRRMVSEAIRGDDAWDGGDYKTQPPSLRTAIGMLFFVSDNPKRRSDAFPTDAAADKALDDLHRQGDEDGRRQRRALRDRKFVRLRSVEKSGSDPRAAAWRSTRPTT